MNIADWVKDKGEAEAWRIIKSIPELGFLTRVFKSASDIVPTSQKLGWVTLDDAKNAVFTLASVLDPDVIEPKPNIDLANCAKVSWVEIDSAIRNQKYCDPKWHQFWNDDSEYYAPSYQDLLSLADRAQGWIKRFGYVNGGSETNDCDDTVKAVLGWLSQNGLGNLALCGQTTIHSFLGQDLGGHKSILVYCSDKILYQWEPMGNADGTLITPANFPRLNGFTYATGNRLVTAFF